MWTESENEILADESLFMKEPICEEIKKQFNNEMELIKTSFKDRIKDKTIDLTSYLKHDGGNGKTKTGRALLMNKTINLSVVDVDINKSFDDDKKEQIRKNIISKLNQKDVIVKTASGGLHIYCNTEGYYVQSNRMIKCFSCEDYDVDLMSCVDENKRSLVVLPGSKVRKSGRDAIKQYSFVQGSFDSLIIRSLSDIIHDLDIKITIKQTPEIEKIVDDYKQYTISDELAEALVNGLVGLEIHNDGGSRCIDDEITLFTLFQAINSLSNKYVEEAYDNVRNKCKLTDNAFINFDKSILRYQHLHSSPFVLVKIIKRWNNEYYEEHVKPLLSVYEIVMNKIDLNDTFNMNNIREKAESKKYHSKKEVIEDLSKVVRYIDDGSESYVIKSFDTFTNTYQLKFVNDAFISRSLRRINLWKSGNEQITVYSLFIEHLSKFCMKGVKFNSSDENVLSLFHGFAHNILEHVDMNKIQMFLELIKEVICNNNELVYQYVLNWIAFVVQNPGVKTGIAMVLKGLQGIGKNRFTDTICEIMKGYSAKNITDINELTGQFNSIVEGKMMIVLNELKNCGDDRLANFNALKSIITDIMIRINEKNQPRRDAENVANFIFCTNNSFPVKIDSGDRRYVVLDCNGKHKGDFDYFKTLCDGFDDEFYDNLLTFFIKRDISTFEVRDIPMTEAKQDLIDASKSPIDQWICDNYNNLCDGIPCADALLSKPAEMRDRAFQLQLKDKCERKRKRVDAKLVWYYVLKDECKGVYQQTSLDVDEEEYNNDNDEIPV